MSASSPSSATSKPANPTRTARKRKKTNRGSVGGKRRKITTEYASPTSVTIHKMASKKFDGWKVKFKGQSCGKVKFVDEEDETFLGHMSVDFQITQKYRGKHIGRIALAKAIDVSDHTSFVAYLRKSNKASYKALQAIGFKEAPEYNGRQMCMTYLKA